MEGNLVLMGRYIDQVDVEVPVIFSLDPDTAARIGGPATVPPPVYLPTDIAFDPNSKDYWVVDRSVF